MERDGRNRKNGGIKMNQCNFIGNLTKDTQRIKTQSNTPMTKFTIAVNDRQDKAPIFLDILTFKNTAENCAKYLTKGSKVFVTGELQLNEYESEGKKYSRPELTANRVEFLSIKKADESDMPFPEVEKPIVKPNDDDLPF